MLPLLLAALAASAAAKERVKVQVYLEVGCPCCQDFVKGPLKSLLDQPDIADIADVDIVPFGNAYYDIPQCPGSEEYDSESRTCWNSYCSPDGTKGKLTDRQCVRERLICQFGSSECVVNSYLACAKHSLPAILYRSFTACVMDGFNGLDEEDEDEDPEDMIMACARGVKLPKKKMLNCAWDPKKSRKAVAAQALLTPRHKFVPWILVDGKRTEAANVLAAVCRAYGGSKPKGCKAAKALQLAVARRKAAPVCT